MNQAGDSEPGKIFTSCPLKVLVLGHVPCGVLFHFSRISWFLIQVSCSRGDSFPHSFPGPSLFRGRDIPFSLSS